MNVKNFDPRFLQLWRDASLKEIVLPVDKREQAINFRQRRYFLRKSMKAEGHAFADAATKVTIRVEYRAIGSPDWIAYTNNRAMSKICVNSTSAAWRLRMIPYGYDAILERAGYKVPEAPDRPDWERVKKDILA
jgi:hypothetical protein